MSGAGRVGGVWVDEGGWRECGWRREGGGNVGGGGSVSDLVYSVESQKPLSDLSNVEQLLDKDYGSQRSTFRIKINSVEPSVKGGPELG